MQRRSRLARLTSSRAARRRRGRHQPASAPASSHLTAGVAARDDGWTLDELGAALVELGLYPDDAAPSLRPLAEPA
jgi:hypothetical protein